MEYRVTWLIDIDAESFEDAARLAREIQLDPESIATHFIVLDRDGNEREVWTEDEDRR
jgi:spore germination protein YaaH